MDRQMIEVLNTIDFAQRYKTLCNQYPFDYYKERFINYNNSCVLDILLNIGYQVKYLKKENFQSRKTLSIYQFKYNISIRSGGVELIWYVRKNNKYYAGDSFSNLEYDLLGLENRRPLPIFRNYEDLKEILIISYQLYEDMTAAFLKAQGISD